jgi:hypothetical protein
LDAALAASFVAGLADGFAAALAAGFAAGLVTALPATVLAADFTGLLAAAVAGRFLAGCAALDLVAEVLTGFLLVAMGLSTIGNCRCCNGNWNAVRADYFSRLAVRSHFCAG